MQLHALLLQAVQQSVQQLPVVELPLTGQVQSLGKALGQAGLVLRHAAGIERLGFRQAWALAVCLIQQLGKAARLGCVLPVPHDQGAVLLKKHRLFKLSDQLGPTLQAMLAHAHHAQFGDGRFGQRGQHGRRHTGRCTLGIGLLRFKHLDPMAFLGQSMGEQAAHQTRAEHHAPRPGAHAATALS